MSFARKPDLDQAAQNLSYFTKIKIETVNVPSMSATRSQQQFLSQLTNLDDHTIQTTDITPEFKPSTIGYYRFSLIPPPPAKKKKKIPLSSLKSIFSVLVFPVP